MKIALYHNLPSGGARRAVYEMVKRLAGRGHLVDEFCPTTADLGFLPLTPFVRQTFSYPFQPRGVYPQRIPFLTPYLTWGRLMADWGKLVQLNRQIAYQMAGGEYDCVFSHDCQLMLTPSIMGQVGLPTLHYCHHIPLHRAETVPAQTFIQRVKQLYYDLPVRAYPQWVQWREGVHLRQADRLLVNSQFVYQALQKQYRVLATVCYLGVDGQQFRPLALDREPFVLHVGAIHAGKGQRFLVEAISKMPAHSRPPLVIAANSWDNQEYQALQQQAARLGVQLTIQNVTDSEELVLLYNRARLMLYASLAEPWGLAVVEAMACGTPVLALAAGGLLESVIDGVTGLLSPVQPQLFAEMLIALYQNENQRQLLGGQAAEYVRQRFSWEATVDQLEQQLAVTR